MCVCVVCSVHARRDQKCIVIVLVEPITTVALVSGQRRRIA